MNCKIAFRSTKSDPCPVCGTGTKGCSATEDGLHLCRGDPQPGWRRLKKEPSDTGHYSYRREDDERHKGNGQPPAIPPAPPRNWRPEAERYARALTDQHRADLVAELELPASCFAAFPLLGYRDDPKFGYCWTFPEVDADGTITGITRRIKDPPPDVPNKRMIDEGKHGLYVPEGWRERPGPVLIPEGASDVLALTAAGLSAVGRFSNTGGTELLARLLKDVDKDIIVLGENDKKPDGKWPGMEGKKVAEKLAAALNRPVQFRLPADGAKDARVWVRRLAIKKCKGDWSAAGPEVLASLADRATEEPPPPSRFKFIDSAEFLAGDYRPQWLVPRVLVRGQPGVIAGPSKGMKTSLLIDLAVSMATATPFLGTFPVRERVRVAVVSGESGEHTLKETCLRVLRAKGLDADALNGWFRWEFTLPTFSDMEVMADFGSALARVEADVVIIDPTYLALGDIDAKNLFEMGAALRTIATVLRKLRPGLTVLLVHHANRLLPVGEPMELQHLAYSGLEQFARQFVLLNRREPYRNDGEHELWVRAGGSVGHGGLWAVHISEGLVEEDFTGRRWEVSVRTPDQVADAAGMEREQHRRDQRRERNDCDENCVLAVIDAEAAKGYPGASVSWIGDQVEFGDARVKAALDRLVERGIVVKVAPFEKSSGNGAKIPVRNGYGRTPDR